MKKLAIVMFLFVLPSCALDVYQEEFDKLDHDEQSITISVHDASHCVVGVAAESIATGEIVSQEKASEARCFKNFSEAVEFATRGRVQLPRGAVPEDVDDELLNGGDIGIEATYVIGIEYQHSNFGGATLTFTSSVTCYGYTHSYSNLSYLSGWNDTISSARAYSGCTHSYHYEHAYFGGAIVDCGTSCSYVGGAMNDRTSSLRWFR